MSDLNIEHHGHVALVEICRPPNNFFDTRLINEIADAFEAADRDPGIRALVLASQGKHFCAGANFGDSGQQEERRERRLEDGNPLYAAGVRLFACRKPVIGAIQGAAVGGGFGLALMPDFRVVCPEARFTANFVKLGFHPGFGLTYTLPRLIGQQRAALMFMTGRRIDGETAYDWGMADVLTSAATLRDAAMALAGEIAENAPLAVASVRATLRAGIADAIKRQTDHEFAEQFRLQQTEDHREGVRAVAERRPGNFKGR
ncbi:MAG: enoyl-CoA hydratase/isomerase family protein [Pseudomonadales bacterium]